MKTIRRLKNWLSSLKVKLNSRAPGRASKEKVYRFVGKTEKTVTRYVSVGNGKFVKIVDHYHTFNYQTI